MNIKKTFIIIIFLFLLLVLGLLFIKKPVSAPQSDIKKDEVIGIEVIYIDNTNNQQLKVVYNNTLNTATIYPNETNQVVFNATTSGSGARYENLKQGLILWNKGDDVSLYLNDSPIFTGTDINKKVNEPVSENDNSKILGSWTWQETVLSNKEKIIPKDKNLFSITFEKDGNISGKTDCNGFGGTYSNTDVVLSFGPLVSTLMYCEGSQETEFTSYLSKTVNYSIQDDNELKLLTSDNETIILKRK